MNNFNSLYPLRRIHGIVHEWLERKKKKWEFILYICCPLGEKYYVLGTPQHTNLGDSAIVLSEISFLKQCGIREKRIKEVTTEEYKEYKDILKARIRKSDKIFLHGGGNMGDQWLGEELLRRDMLSTFEENKIIIFPQTIFYSDTTKGQKEEKNSISFYNRNNLTIVAREYMSFERMKYLYPNANVLLTSDIVLSTNKDIFGVKLSRDSLITSSIFLPNEDCIAAFIPPSIKGAEVILTFADFSSSSIDIASSELIKALPKSQNIITPSSEYTLSIALKTSTASVPISL